MKRLFLILSLVMLDFYTLPTMADDVIYVSPDVARAAIEKHFSHIVSANSDNFTSDSDDATVLGSVVEAYNEMLKQNDGFVSVDGVVNVCNIAYNNLQPKITGNPNNDFSNECVSFATDLVTEQAQTDNNCIYTVSKVDGSQMHIKYANKNGTGFIRHTGSIPWRFLNPGALRGSSLQCASIYTKPNGYFAAFESAEVGKKALHLVLTGDAYKGRTIAQAMYKYAPPAENNTVQYVNKLRNKGIDVNKVLPNLTQSEWEQLENAIMTLEGWNKTGTVESF